MNALYGLFNAGLAIAAYALLPKEYSEYIALGLIIFISSINRWELNKILKALKANTKSESKVLNIPCVIKSVCDCGKPIDSRYAPCCSLKCWDKKFL